MAITLDLPPEEERSLGRQAEMAGQDVTDCVREMVRGRALPAQVRLSDEEREKLLDEFGDTAPPNAPLLSEYAVSREGIYGDHG